MPSNVGHKKTRDAFPGRSIPRLRLPPTRMESSDADSPGSQLGWHVAGGGVMADVHVQLVLDYVQARSSHDRTEAALARRLLLDSRGVDVPMASTPIVVTPP